MDEVPYWVWWLVGILLGVIFTLIGVIYWSLRAEVARLAKNIHSLRTTVQTVVIVLAAHGITVRRDDDERG